MNEVGPDFNGRDDRRLLALSRVYWAVIWGLAVAAALLLSGCGHKAAWTSPYGGLKYGWELIEPSGKTGTYVGDRPRTRAWIATGGSDKKGEN